MPPEGALGPALPRRAAAAAGPRRGVGRHPRLGAAAVEAALLAAFVLVPLWLGGMEIVQASRDSMRVWRVAEEVANVASQYEVLRTGPPPAPDDRVALRAVAREASRPMRVTEAEGTGAIIVSGLVREAGLGTRVLWQEKWGRACAPTSEAAQAAGRAGRPPPVCAESRFGTEGALVEWAVVARATGTQDPGLGDKQGAVVVEVLLHRSPWLSGVPGAAAVGLAASQMYGFSMQKPRAAAVLRRSPP